MGLISFKNVSKIYNKKEEGESYALKQFSFDFQSVGLVSIFGKSGSGKSTILNLLSLMDKPDEGEIFFNSENINLYNDKNKQFYLNEQIGILFQNYNLLEDESVQFNLCLPLLIKGESKSSALNIVKDYLKFVNLGEEYLPKKVNILSGGEKQRIALVRSIVNSPRVLVADEPTGALDSKNASAVMDILKKYSERHLVVLVSHNKELVKKYSDTIIYIKDGKIEKADYCKRIDLDLPAKEYVKSKKSIGWVETIATSNIKRRKKRDILSFLGLLVGLTSTVLVVGFANGSKASIKKESLKVLDYGSLTYTKEISKKISGSMLSITQTLKPSEAELNNTTLKERYYVEPNFDSLVTPLPDFYWGEHKISTLQYIPVYNFKDDSINSTLLINGKMPTNEKNEVVINKKAYEVIKDSTKQEPIGQTFLVKSTVETVYTPSEEGKENIKDLFEYSKNIKIVGVVDELTFLQNPKVYYSYETLRDELLSKPMTNLSEYLKKQISWYERVETANVGESISSYSYRLFCKNRTLESNIVNDIEKMNKPFALNSNAITISQTYTNLLTSMSSGLTIFLVVAIIGTILIVGIISYSNYTEDQRRSAILSSLGAGKESIMNIYICETAFISVFAYLSSLIVGVIFQTIINAIVKSTSGIANIIQIPFASFLGVRFLFPLLVLVILLLVVLLSTIIPILFCKKISLKKELQSL